MGDVLVQYSPHIQQTPTRRQWHQGTHNIPGKRARELAEVLKTLVPPNTAPPARKEDFHFTLPATPIKQVDQPPKSFKIQSTPQRQSQLEETPQKIQSKSPPSSRTPLIRSSSNLTVSDPIKKFQDGSKNLNKTEGTPSSQRMEVGTPSSFDIGMRMDISGDSADKFWDGADFKNHHTYTITLPTSSFGHHLPL